MSWVFRKEDLNTICLDYDCDYNLYIIKVKNELLSYDSVWSDEEVKDVIQRDRNIVGWPIHTDFYWRFHKIMIAVGWENHMTGTGIHCDNVQIVRKISSECNNALNAYFQNRNGFDIDPIQVDKPHGSWKLSEERSKHDRHIQQSMKNIVQGYRDHCCVK